MFKKNIFSLATLLLSVFIFQLPAFAASATISVSGNRGIADLSASAAFPVDPTTGKTGGTVTIIRDGMSLYQASPTTSAWSYSRQYDTTNLTDGPHVFTITAAAWDGSSGSASQAIVTNNSPIVNITSPAEGLVRGVSEVNIAYSFPNSLWNFSYIALELTIDGGSLPGYVKWLSLNSASETQGTWKVTIDTSLLWRDGPHTLKVTAKLPIGGPNTATDTITIDSNNTPLVNIISPQGTVKGVAELNIAYSFPSLKQPIGSQPYISLTIDDGVLPAYVKWFPLSSSSETIGNWIFSIDTKNWPDGPHTFKVTTLTYNVGTAISNITVANKAVEILKSKQLPQDKATTVAEPINVATGNMFTSSADILIPSKEIPLELSRTYNSQDDFNGSFGYGWRSNFDVTLTEQPDQSVAEVDENGVYTVYAKNPDGTYTPSSGKYSILAKNPDGTFTILRKHGRKLYFNSSGLLTKIEERNSHSLNILRYSSGIIAEVSDSSDRKLTFISNSEGKTTQITDPAGRIFKYEYDVNGNLVKTIDSLNNETLYQYDSNHNLIQQTDANGHLLNFEYDSSDRAYHSWQDDDQNNEVILAFDTVNKATITTDSLGNATKYEYNDYGLVTKITDSQGNTQAFVWDGQLNKVSTTNQNGFTTTFTYDSRGNLLTIKDPLNNITIFTYESSFDLIASVTDALGNKTEYLYDAKGNLLQVKDALGNTASYSYDAQGQITQLKDANGNITNFSYDAYGSPSQITDALDNQTNFTYDIIGNLIRITDAKGSPTNFTYNSLNHLTKITYPDNSQVNYAYDKAGNLISFTDQNGNATAYAYDAVNRLTHINDAQGNLTQYTYDTEGNRLSIIDANLNKTQYFYDSLSRLIKTLDPLDHQTLFSYDPAGNLISKIDANGNTINYAYDALGRLIKKQYPDLTEQTFIYDARGNLLTAANPDISYRYTYDPLGRLMIVIDSSNRLISYAYDALGNHIQMTTPEGKTINYGYDALNRLTSILDIHANTITYAYDSLGRRVSAVLPDATKAAYAYDSLNNLLSLVNQGSDDAILSSYTYEYDKAGNKLVKSEPDLKTSYNYDALYRLKQVLSAKLKEEDGDKEKIAELYAYDALGNRLTSLKDNYTYNIANQLFSANDYSYEYDQNGNLIKKTEVDDDGKSKTTTYAYDFENRLIQVLIQKDDETTTSTFKYDPFGRRIEKSVARQEEGKTASEAITYVYDNEDIILEYTTKTEDSETKDEAIRYVHGPGTDEPISIEKDSQLYYYHYDGLGSVTSLTDSTGRTIESHTYDSFGNLERQGNKAENRFTYTGREYDKETELYYYRNRYYDPKIGRFLSRDSLGMIDGPNLYTYVNNNPINFIDPWGFSKKNNNVKEELGLVEDYFGIDLLVLGIIAAVEPTPAGEVALVGRIAGYTKHGLEQAIGREGRGVAAKAILDAVKNPIKIIRQSGGRIKYIGKQATVIINRMGKIITTWGQPR